MDCDISDARYDRSNDFESVISISSSSSEDTLVGSCQGRTKSKNLGHLLPSTIAIPQSILYKLRAWRHIVFLLLMAVSVFTYSSVKGRFSMTIPAMTSSNFLTFTTRSGLDSNLVYYPMSVLLPQSPSSPCSSLVASEELGVLGRLLSVDVVYGDLSFPAAKLIDLVWVVVFGRGVQTVMMWAVYHLLMASVGWIAESRPVPYSLFVSTTMSPVDWSSLGPLGSFAATRLALRHKLLVSWLMFATFWVVMFSTVVSAMTGYINFVDPNQNTLVKLNQPGQYMNLTDFKEFAETTFQVDAEDNSGVNKSILVQEDGPYPLLWESLNETLKKPVSIWTTASASQIIFSYSCSQNNSTCPDGIQEANVTCFRDLNGTLYDWTYTDSLDNVICLQGFGYQWGFSSVMIAVFLCCNTFWIVGMFISWEVLMNKSHFMKKPRLLGRYRAIVDLGEAIREELGPNISALSDSTLEKELKKRPAVRYHVFDSEKYGTEYPHISLSADNSNGKRIRLHRDTLYS